MKKTAVLAAYFGSPDTESMDLLEAALAEAFPGCPVRRAFLSRRFPAVDSVEQALIRLQAFDHVLVQAMLVSTGPSYAPLLERCPALPIGPPLLASPDACAAAVANWLPKPLLLMGHGAPDSDLTEFAAHLPDHVYFAVMEGKPGLDSVLPQLAGRQLHLAPFLLTAGTHAARDLAAWKTRLEAAGCRVKCHTATLAHCPGIPAIFAQHLQSCSSGGSLCL